MGTLKEDINKGSEWIVRAFKADGIFLDYSIDSFIEIDRFFNKNVSNGKAKANGRLANNLGSTLFSIASYIGTTIIKNVPGSIWITYDEAADGELTVSINLPTNVVIFPMQRIMKR